MDWRSDEKSPLEDDGESPEWATAEVSTTNWKQAEAEFLMMRLSSHYISTVQPQLEDFINNNINNFWEINEEMPDSSMHSIKQFSIYQKYTELFESLVEDFTSSYSKNDLIEAIKSAHDLMSQGKESTGTLVLELLEAVSSFQGLL